MIKTSLSVTAIALAALPVPRPERPALALKEERVTIEYTPARDEAVVVVDAETEAALDRVEVRDPGGRPVLNVGVQRRGAMALSGFVLESRELPLAVLRATYGEGLFDLRGRSVDGQQVLGSAMLSHELLPEPIPVFPWHGARVAATDLTVSWHADPLARGYRVVLEQGENDGLVVQLAPGTSSFRVPDGVLAPRTETQLEIGVLGPNGNCTVVEVLFETD